MIEAKETLTGNIISNQTITGGLNKSVKTIYPSLENITITPTKEQQVFTHINSYGYDKVTVDGIPNEYIIPAGTLEVTENGEYDVKGYAEAIVNVESSGGSLPIMRSYSPAIYKGDFNGATVTTNGIEIICKSLGVTNTGEGLNIVIPCIVAIFVRSNYTLSDNLEVIAETDWTEVGGNTQKLIVCWCDDINQNITVTQETSGRFGIGFVSFRGDTKPKINVFKNESGYSVKENRTLPLKKGVTIYFVTGVYMLSKYLYKPGSLEKLPASQDETKLYANIYSDRLQMCIYYTDEDCNTILSGTDKDSSDIGLIGITVE